MSRYESVACCDDCWWVPENTFARLGNAIREPMRIRQEMRREEFCHFCGWTTYSGVYVRVDTDAQPAASLHIRKEY